MMNRKKTMGWILTVLLSVLLLTGAAGEASNACTHDWRLIRSTAPTCTRKGKDVYRCGRCGEKRTETVDALGHAWDSCVMERMPTCTETGLIRCTCSRDASHVKDQIQPALGHKWGEWKTIRAAGLSRSGLKERSCERCRKTERETLPPQIRRKEYELHLLVFPEAGPVRHIDPAQVRGTGKGEISLRWICALANTGKKDLWIREEGTETGRLPLAAGDVTLLPVQRTLSEKDLLEARPDTPQYALRFVGETETGEAVCRSETVPVQILTDAAVQEKTVPQEGEEMLEICLEGPETDACTLNDLLRYTVVLRNNGRTVLSGVEISGMPGMVTQTPEDLLPGEERRIPFEYLVSRQDAMDGYLGWAVTARLPGEDENETIILSNPLILRVDAGDL